MAHLIGLEEAEVYLGTRPVLGNLTLGIDDSQRIGVVGPNGAGKSTLLKLFSGQLQPDHGRLTMVRNTQVQYLQQRDDFPPTLNVEAAIHPGKSAHEWASDPAMRQIHAGLLAGIPLTAQMGELSGGQRRRVALAAVLCAPSQLLILDEPTNHLDVEGINFLAQYLRDRYSSKGALLVVTHDRWFLDAVCTSMWEVVGAYESRDGKTQVPGRVETYEGGYAAYVLARAERARRAQVAEEKRQNLLRKELAWLRRGAPARTSKPRFRIEAAEALIANVPPLRDTVELTKTAMSRLGKDVIDLENITFAYPERQDAKQLKGEDPRKTENSDLQPPLFQELTWRLAPGERVGVVGVNGAGKSTLLQLLQGALPVQQGRVKIGKTVRLRQMSQDTTELDEVAHLRVVEAVAKVRERVMVGKQELSASQLVEKLGFSRERAWTLVSKLSGGERRRLQLLRIMVDDPNVLLLDEPTNDLDTDTLAAMEDLLDGWAGTLVVVSHDRYLLERLTDHQVALLGDGTVKALPGGVEQFLAWRAEISEQAESKLDKNGHISNLGGNKNSNGVNVVAEVPEEFKENPKALAPGSAAERAARKELAKVERQTQILEEKRVAIGLEMAECAQSGDYQKIAELGNQDQELQTQLDELELRWLEIGEQIDL